MTNPTMGKWRQHHTMSTVVHPTGQQYVYTACFNLASDTAAHWLWAPSTTRLRARTAGFSVTSQLDQVALTGGAAELQMLADCGVKTYQTGRTSSRYGI